jgi:hypothetical protein
MKRYSHANWNQVLDYPEDHPRKAKDLRLIGRMATGNLVWFIRRLIATENDLKIIVEHPEWNWQEEITAPSNFIRYMRKLTHEDSVSKDQ